MELSLKSRIGATVRVLRKKRGMTQDQLATASGLSRSTISNVEDAILSPNIETIVSIGKALKCIVNVSFQEN